MPRSLFLAVGLLSAIAPPTLAADLKVDGAPAAWRARGTAVSIDLRAGPGRPAWIAADSDPGPTRLLGRSLPLGFSPAFFLLRPGMTGSNGLLTRRLRIPDDPALVGRSWYFLGLVLDAAGPDFSNGASLTVVEDLSRTSTPLAGNPLGERPHFEYVRAFNQGTAVHLAVDPGLHPEVIDREVQVFLVRSKDAAAWDSDPRLIDVSDDGPDAVTFSGTDIAANIFELDGGSLDGGDGTTFGVGFDVVIDLDRDRRLSPGDLIDGYGDEAGLYVVHDVTRPGPYAVTESLYTFGQFLGQDLFYPTRIDLLGRVPLIVVSHGNGHNYQWYDHIGRHLASYGYVVMSHQNNTGPGIKTASTSTLDNTDVFLGNLDQIDGGMLVGHVDGSRIVWIGHSRGGEGIVRAYHRLTNGNYVPQHYSREDVVLVSSIAPTDFGGVKLAAPHDVPYHLWVGGADADVTGCASNNVAQSFHLLDRAQGQRQSISLHGVGHGDFHNGQGRFARGPCQVGRADTHAIMRGYLLPLVEYHLKGNPAAKDFLVRQWESFHPLGAPVANPCVVVDLQFREDAALGTLVIDDFQTNPETDVASSGAAVSFTVRELDEGPLNDANRTFDDDPADPFNGFTQGRGSDTTRGLVFSADGAGDYELTYTLAAGSTDWSAYSYLSFRACQATRHPLTTLLQGDTVFDVELTDAGGTRSIVSIGAFGGGIEEPYQRDGCGRLGVGWGNEFETIRLPLSAFRTDLPAFDLGAVTRLSFRFGPSHGTPVARLGLDDIELTTD